MINWLRELYWHFALKRYERDELGRPIVSIASEDQLQDYIDHPENLPPGNLRFRSAIPYGPKFEELLRTLGSKRGPQFRMGVTGPPPVATQEQLGGQFRAVLDTALRAAGGLAEAEVDQLRHRASLAAEDGFLTVPVFFGDPAIGKLLADELDVHRHDACPLEQDVRKELENLLPVAAGWLKISPDVLRPEIGFRCRGGMEGLVPTFCRSVGEAVPYEIEIGHGFHYACAVAAWSCAARVRLSDGEPRTVTAKEINDALRWVVAWYSQQTDFPQIASFVAKMLPHQLLIVNGLMKGMRRFALAHELGHILMWKTQGNFREFGVPLETLGQGAALYGVPFDTQEEWAAELACDLLALKLLQETFRQRAPSTDPSFDPRYMLEYQWDFAGAHFALTLWDELAARAGKAGRSIDTSHPPGHARKNYLSLAYPKWLQPFAVNLSGMLEKRLPNI